MWRFKIPGPDLINNCSIQKATFTGIPEMCIYYTSSRARAGQNPKVLLLLVVLVAALITGAGAGAAKRALVKPIEESKLDEMIGAKDNRLVVTFMAAWCGPCIDELPVLNKLYQKHEKSGLKLIGISIDLEGTAAMQPIVDKLSIKFPIYWYGEKAVKKFKLNAIPMLFFIKEGEIVEKAAGRHPERSLNKKFKEFLK
jgi:thiol-disulfide isomerase/thioredoxin